MLHAKETGINSGRYLYKEGRGTQYRNTVRTIGKYRYRIYDRSRLLLKRYPSRVFVYLKHVCVAVNFLFQLIFIFLLFLGMVMYANEF